MRADHRNGKGIGSPGVKPGLPLFDRAPRRYQEPRRALRSSKSWPAPLDLEACVDESFASLSYIEVTVDGQTTADLDDYVLTTDLIALPEDDLFSADAGISLTKGYFVVVRPLSKGTHTLRAYDEFEEFDFTAGITYNIIVE